MVKLTKTMATIIAARYFPRCKLERLKGYTGQIVFGASTGYLTLEIENDWRMEDGYIRVWLRNARGEGNIMIKIDPKTMEPV